MCLFTLLSVSTKRMKYYSDPPNSMTSNPFECLDGHLDGHVESINISPQQFDAPQSALIQIHVESLPERICAVQATQNTSLLNILVQTHVIDQVICSFNSQHSESLVYYFRIR